MDATPSSPSRAPRPHPAGEQIDATGRISASGRALVLHGGGSVGNAWEIGVIAGLCEGGLDVTAAEVIIGTSAGSTAAAQITGAKPAELLAAILDAGPGQPPASKGRPGSGHPGRPAADHLERTGRIIAAAHSAADMRRRMGAAALELEGASDVSARERWRATVAARLPRQSWPDQTILITAVDALSGEPVVFDRRSGVDLVDAVAASCSSGIPYMIGNRQYIDGGYRRNENADLARGCSRVLVLSPFGGRTRHPLEWRMQLASQVEELRAAGSVVETVCPDGPSRQAFGGNMMDLSARPPAARAGHRQGRALADELSAFWR
ncbi:patatin [Sinomonas atrocyanea]|uniref:Patatin n=1 Tax=Sinomonas atrocyanea TaxID=37927 RepID=A0A127AA78_9MICC|nr:patatin-like phospholipase family protein [Sinomonas atrocyanea]AMM34582.1 patatin [Sinomonas atrocyanea]GEB63060.1 patatin [Sinomonas atrocyanea]GGG72697.1 patatin [Sinomonas atrocyanea]